MKTINSIKEFNTLVKTDKPILLDFYADWCGPCQSLMPTLEQLGEEFNEKAEIVKINVDNNRELAAHFKVRSIPALFFIKDKKVVNQMQGMQTKSALSDVLKKLNQNEPSKN